MELDKRKYIIYAFCLIVFFAYVTRLAYLQLFTADESMKESDKNSLKTITITPPRGLMYDRNGKVLVDNKPSYSVTITPSQFDKNNLNEIATLLEIPPDDLLNNLKNIKGTNRFNPAKIKRDVEF
ncbi:MAG: penicillin-binding protein 2, partial [Ignavibacteria bacterium]|nr:penicillin-binding protein 2 [Ignavibacteria bacterium]